MKDSDWQSDRGDGRAADDRSAKQSADIGSESAGSGAPSPPLPASRYIAFFSIALLGALLDLATKHWVFVWRNIARGPEREIYWIVEGYFGIETTLNAGALFGLGAGYAWLFAALSVAAAVGIVYWLFYLQAAHNWLLTIALAAVTAGIIGNLYDRLGLWSPPWNGEESIYMVRDWILLEFRGHTWPNFNIADMLLVGGAIVLVALQTIWHGDEEAGESSSG